MRAGECQNDICCFGTNSCPQTTFEADGFIRSLSCEGSSTCRGISASPVLGDLICHGTRACQDSLIDFTSDIPAEHVITCDAPREEACVRSTFRFDGVAWCQDHGKSCHLRVFQRDV